MATVGVEWINNFPPPCDQNELSYCDETSQGFKNGMTSRGHTASFDWANGNAFETDFRDPAFAGGGDDTHWVDNVDFAHFSAHGGTNNSNLFQGYFGGQHNQCTSAFGMSPKPPPSRSLSRRLIASACVRPAAMVTGLSSAQNE